MAKHGEMRPPWWRSRSGVVLLVFLGIGGYFLFTEHLAHTIQALPYLLLLCCIVMVIYMSRSHNPEDGGRKESGDQAKWRKT